MRSRLFLIIVSLITRLWWTFEYSRLAFLRMKPRIINRSLVKQQEVLPRCEWLFSRNKLYCLSVDEQDDNITIIATPPIELN